MISFTRALAREVGQFNINVNTIAPGYTLSDPVLNRPQPWQPTDGAAINSRCFKRSQEPDDIVGTGVVRLKRQPVAATTWMGDLRATAIRRME